jgi:hypothetical protein
MSDERVLSELTAAFDAVERPEHFTNHAHCCECYEHDELLRSRARDEITLDDVGSEAWDPVCFATPQAFAYLLPALGRLALSPPHPMWGWYGEHLVFHLAWNGAGNDRWRFCSEQQRRAVARLVEHMLTTRSELVDESYRAHLFFQAHEIWSADADRPQ